MSTVRVWYASGEGQTAKVADRVAARLAARGYDADAVDVRTVRTNGAVSAADAVVVGASIHVGKHQDAVRDFVTANRDALAERPTAFFQVSLSSASDDPERRAQAAQYVDEFLDATDWHPDRVALFAGALRYSKYGFLKRHMMTKIAKEATGDTDASRDYEYTDWAAVDAFADDFATVVERRLADVADHTEPTPEA